MLKSCCTATLAAAAAPWRIWRCSPRGGRPARVGSGAAGCRHRQQLLRLPHGAQVADPPAGGRAAHAAGPPALKPPPSQPAAVMPSQRVISKGAVHA